VEIDDSTDPFGEEAPPMRVEEVGVPIDLSGGKATLDQRLVANVAAQQDLYNQGVDCELRWEDEVSCHACPLYKGDEQTLEGALCRLSREQDVITTLMAVQRRGCGRK
jgi:hypothetical protein